VNGDGYADVIVGAHRFHNGQTDEGRAFVYYGNEGLGRRTHPRQQRTDGTTDIVPPGWSNSETQFRIRADMLSIYGRTRLQMEQEVKPLGVPFDGQGTISGNPFDIGSDGVISFNRLVTGLSPGTAYHWRVRAKYDLVKTPFQRNGPWVHLPAAGGWNETDLKTAGGLVEVPPRHAPPGFDLLAGGANPGRGQCAVTLVMARRARVGVEVVDVQGRTVAVLVQGEAFEAGAHVLRGDGRERRGLEAPAGVYFVRARAGGETRIRKVVLVR